MNKVNDLVTVNAITASRMFQSAQERYELSCYVADYIQSITAVQENCGVTEEYVNQQVDMRFEPFLLGVYENFYVGSKAMTDVRFSPPDSEVDLVVADRAQRAISSLHNHRIRRCYLSYPWEREEFFSAAFLGLWTKFFVVLVTSPGVSSIWLSQD